MIKKTASNGSPPKTARVRLDLAAAPKKRRKRRRWPGQVEVAPSFRRMAIYREMFGRKEPPRQHAAKVVYLALESYAGVTDGIVQYASYDRIEEDWGPTSNTIGKGLAQLIEWGVVRILVKESGKAPPVYQLTLTEAMLEDFKLSCVTQDSYLASRKRVPDQLSCVTQDILREGNSIHPGEDDPEENTPRTRGDVDLNLYSEDTIIVFQQHLDRWRDLLARLGPLQADHLVEQGRYALSRKGAKRWNGTLGSFLRHAYRRIGQDRADDFLGVTEDDLQPPDPAPPPEQLEGDDEELDYDADVAAFDHDLAEEQDRAADERAERLFGGNGRDDVVVVVYDPD